jgi:RNA polymerase sigma-70 factor (ECF subfamily)
VEDDASVIARSNREPAAFGLIFDRHYQSVLRYARRRAGIDEGEEIAARTFLLAFELRERFAPQATTALPWLLGIATNLLRHRARSERVHLASLARVPAPLDEELDLETSLDAERARGEIAEALVALRAEARDALLLNVLGGLGYAEVAAALQIPIGTVRSTISRAKAQLRERLARLEAIVHEGMEDEDTGGPDHG